MSVLRVNKIAASGQTSENTGSVFFDGTGDYLSIPDSDDFNMGTGDFTLECWINSIDDSDYQGIFGSYDYDNAMVLLQISNTGVLRFINPGTISQTGTTDLQDGNWHHIVMCRSGSTLRGFVDGIEEISTSYSASIDWGHSNNSITIGVVDRTDYPGQYEYKGFISNVRVIKGKALYTSNFTPPTTELEVTPETVLVACHDGEDIFAEKTGKIIAAYGDRTSSPTPTATDSPIGITTFQPGLTRSVDPTAGPVFQGSANFNSQNWLTLPKGTTTERFYNFPGVDAASARGVFGGGESPQHTLDYITISTTGNSQTFGDMSLSRYSQGGGVSSNTRGCWGGGQVPSPSFTFYNTIDYVTIASTGDSQDFGDLSTTSYDVTGTSNSTRGLFSYGTSGPGFALVGNIEFITIQSTGNAFDFGNLSVSRVQMGGASSSTRGLFAGGLTPGRVNVIDYVSHPTTGNAVDFGDLNLDINGLAGCSSPTRAIFGGGLSPAVRNEIDFVTIATLGNASDFGDLTVSRTYLGAVSSSVRGVFGGGSDPSNVDTIDYVTIASAGDATDFGDLGRGASRVYGGCSNGHGGLG